MKLNVKALSLASGIVVGAYSFVVAEAAVFTGAGLEYVSITGPLHPGYSPTPLGALILSVWMFIYGLIGGAMIAAIYNHFEREEKK